MNNKRKILIVGDFGSIHIYNYAKNVLAFCDADIHGFNIGGPVCSIDSLFMETYNQLGIKIQGGIKLKQGKIAYMRKAYNVLSKMGSYDYCHVHFVSHYICPIIFLLRHKYTVINLSFWGSDLYRVNYIARSLYRPLIYRSKIISFITTDMLNSFKKLYPQKKLQKTFRILDFGNPFLRTIDSFRQSAERESLYDLIHLNSNKKTLTIGYRWLRKMRQYETLTYILPILDKKNIQIAIPAYGIPKEEKERIDSLISSFDIEHQIYDYFMGEQEVSALRCLTDVFIHPQTTDALSNAMLEHIYAGSVVLNGEWLNYSILDENDVYYLKFKSLSELPAVLQKIISNLDTHQERARKNCDIVRSFISWEYWTPKWLELYNNN